MFLWNLFAHENLRSLFYFFCVQTIIWIHDRKPCLLCFYCLTYQHLGTQSSSIQKCFFPSWEWKNVSWTPSNIFRMNCESDFITNMIRCLNGIKSLQSKTWKTAVSVWVCFHILTAKTHLTYLINNLLLWLFLPLQNSQHFISILLR